MIQSKKHSDHERNGDPVNNNDSPIVVTTLISIAVSEIDDIDELL